MPDPAVETPVFQIGFNRCGTKFLTEIFRLNGYRALHWRRGKLAEDILYSKNAGGRPLSAWRSASLFADMECCHRYDKPLLEGFREFAFLDASFPGAYFILNLRDVSDWIASRSAHHGGQYIKFHAHHLNVPLAEVPALWQADWDRHVEAVQTYFAGHPRFLTFHIDTDPPTVLADFLADDFRLTEFPSPDPSHLAKKKAANRRALAGVAGAVRPLPKQAEGDSDVVDHLVAHCLGTRGVPGETGGATYSGLYGRWDGDRTVLKKDGTAWRLLRCKLAQGEAFLTNEAQAKIDRLQGVLNACLGLGHSGALAIDMQDGRRFGMAGLANPDAPVLAYNRRPEARNVVLWPLPGYHDIGLETFAQSETPDVTPFDKKRDAVAWRGSLAGRAGFHKGRVDGRPSQQILRDLLAPDIDRKTERRLTRALSELPRFEFLSRHQLLPDFDLAFTLPDKFKRLTETDKLGAFCGPRKPISWFHQFKYLVCLSGHDTGSNFFVAANSYSVVFKEDDGWELFYTSLFRPWEHYIPIATGGADMQEKLAWARAHPEECKAMSKASRAACRLLADPDLREKMLRGVLAGLAG